MIQYYADSDASGNIIGYYNDDIWDVAKIPATAIKITQVQWQDAVANQGKYVVKTGALTLAPAPTAAQQLTTAIANKNTELDAASIKDLRTFVSTALGKVNTYLTRADATNHDMAVFTAEFGFVTGAYYDNKPILWYTVEQGNVTHTKDQFIQSFLNGRTATSLRKLKVADQMKQAKAATTVAGVQAIVWADPWAVTPAVPSGLTGTAGAAGTKQVALSWTASTEDVMANGGGYNIYVDGAATPVNTAPILGTAYTATGLLVGAHTFQITAVGANGKESAKCTAVSVTVS